VAVTTSLPTGSVVIDKFALPPLILAVPNGFPLLLNATIFPLGRPPLLVRVAVNNTDWPCFEGFDHDFIVIVIRACLVATVKRAT
jgi:hypothetical protein